MIRMHSKKRDQPKQQFPTKNQILRILKTKFLFKEFFYLKNLLQMNNKKNWKLYAKTNISLKYHILDFSFGAG